MLPRIVLFPLIFVTACTSIQRSDLEAGILPFATPRRFDPPGTIYRVDSNHQSFVVSRCSVHADTFAEALSDWKRVAKGNIGLQFLFGMDSTEASTTLGPKVTRDVTVEQSVASAWREQTTDADVQACIDEVRRRSDWIPGNHYYIIRETILADSVSFTFDRHVLNEIGIDVTARQFQVKGMTFHNESQTTSRLIRRFPQPMRVYYKQQQIWPNASVHPGASGAFNGDSKAFAGELSKPLARWIAMNFAVQEIRGDSARALAAFVGPEIRPFSQFRDLRLLFGAGVGNAWGREYNSYRVLEQQTPIYVITGNVSEAAVLWRVGIGADLDLQPIMISFDGSYLSVHAPSWSQSLQGLYAGFTIRKSQ